MRKTPVDIEKFEAEGEEPSGIRQSDVQDAVVSFLSSNPETAYSTSDIADATGQKKQTVNHVVRRLQKKGDVERKRVEGTIYNRWTGLGEEEAEMEA